MNFLFNFLAEGETAEKSWPQEMAGILSMYVFPIVLSVVVLWAIYLGFLLAKAKDEGARQKAKKRFINAFASLFIIMALYMIMMGFDKGWWNKFFKSGNSGGLFEFLKFPLTFFGVRI